ncbi:hypothetical protein L218DRAFT_932802 [Marasmius fiardii PR-910]|nr:hypothetical protein L218DRAFT_932802 [Marasmius fiardii PR-910]
MSITVAAAELLGVIIGSVLYGISALLFAGTVWSLIMRRSSPRVNYVMLGVACIFFFLSTMRIAVDAHNVYNIFINSADAINDLKPVTWKNSIYGVQTLVADAMIIYRCYMVWRNRYILIFLIICWCGTVVTAVHTIWSIAQPTVTANDVYLEETARWVLSFYSSTLVTNAIATSLLAYKLWSVHKAAPRRLISSSPLMPIMYVILECGALYTCVLVTMMGAYAAKSNSAFLVIDIIGPIISIAFYVIIIRATMVRMDNESVYTSGTSTWGAQNRIELSQLKAPRGRPVPPMVSTEMTTDFDTLQPESALSTKADSAKNDCSSLP